MSHVRAGLVWAAVCAAVVAPLAIAASSPLLEYRQPVYIAAGLAGVVGLGLMLLQPLFAAADLPRLGRARGRRVHRWGGILLIASVAVHVAGLWVFSPPDVIDALLLRSATPFSVWGVVAMWAVVAAAAMAALRRRLMLRPMTWRRIHTALTSVAVAGTVAHALLIQGTMGTISKVLLCALVLAATARAVAPVWARGWRRR